MGDCEDCLYYHLGTCDEAEPGTEATCFVDHYEEEWGIIWNYCELNDLWKFNNTVKTLCVTIELTKKYC